MVRYKKEWQIKPVRYTTDDVNEYIRDKSQIQE